MSASTTLPSAQMLLAPRLAAQADDSLFIPSRAHLAGFEQPVLGDPSKGLLKDLLAVGLKHDALAGPPGARVHARMKALGELGLVIVRVELWPHVDIALGTPQCAEELGDVLRVGIAV